MKLLIILLCSEPLLKLLIPSLHVGHVLGKGGSYVNELRSTYKGHIAFSPAQPLYPGTEDRVCLLTGTVQQITDLSYQILNRVRSGNCYFNKFKPHHHLKFKHTYPLISSTRSPLDLLSSSTKHFRGYLGYFWDT